MEIINTNSEWRNKLKKDDIINALDNDGIWYEAIIVNKDENNLEVRFRGWSDKWNLKYDIFSEKIAKRYEKVPDWTKKLQPRLGEDVKALVYFIKALVLSIIAPKVPA